MNTLRSPGAGSKYKLKAKNWDKRATYCTDNSQKTKFNRATFQSNRDICQALSNKCILLISLFAIKATLCFADSSSGMADSTCLSSISHQVEIWWLRVYNMWFTSFSYSSELSVNPRAWKRLHLLRFSIRLFRFFLELVIGLYDGHVCERFVTWQSHNSFVLKEFIHTNVNMVSVSQTDDS